MKFIKCERKASGTVNGEIRYVPNAEVINLEGIAYIEKSDRFETVFVNGNREERITCCHITFTAMHRCYTTKWYFSTAEDMEYEYGKIMKVIGVQS